MASLVAVSLAGCASSSDTLNVNASAEAPEAQVLAAAERRDPAGIAASADQSPQDIRPSAHGDASVAPGATNSLQEAAASISAVGTPGSSAYKIGPQDVVEISVFKVSELSKSVQVSEAGSVNLPLVGEVSIAGMTAREFERDLTTRLGKKYLQNPQVSVFIKEYNSQRITIDGAVRKPGVFPIQGSVTLLQAVALAQGLDDVSDNTVLVFRRTSGQRKAARFDVSEIRSGDAADPQLAAGDVLIAGTSELKKGFNGFLKALPITGLFTLL